jgi:hypothetical protein
MSNPSHSTSPSAGDDRNLVSIDETYLAPTFEDRLRLFWIKNSRVVLVASGLLIAGIVIKGGYGIIAEQHEKAVAAEYGAATDDAQLKAFVATHKTHVLGGLAQLRLADQAYGANHFAEARTLYANAAELLKNSPFGQRARLGSALCALQAGAASDGETLLRQIAADLKADKMVRAESAYHLASLAVTNGNSAEALRLIEQATSIDPEGQWADRATALRSAIPQTLAVTPPAEPKLEGVPTISFK